MARKKTPLPTQAIPTRPVSSADQAFLQAIAATPADDAPRLIYADWLEEHGDPLGEFIRVQCALEQVPEYDERHPALKLREEELMLRHYRQWDAALREEFEGFESYNADYRRGFINRIMLPVEMLLRKAARLPELAPGLCGLELHSPENVAEARQLLETGWLSRISELVLNSVQPDALQVLFNSGQLASLTSLAVHYAEDHSVRVAEQIASCRSLRNLRTLDLTEVALGTRGLQAILSSPNLKRLKTLKLTDVSLAAIRRLADAPLAGQLETLVFDFGDDNFTDAHVSALAASPYLQRLRLLSFHGDTCGDESALALAQSSTLRQLRSHNFGGTKINDAAIAAMTRSRTLARSHWLDSHHCGGDEAAAAVARSPYWKQLNYLALGCERMTEEGAKVLAASANLASMRVLHLCSSRIGADGAAALAESEHLAGLHSLYLQHVEIGDEGLSRLLASPSFSNLRELVVTNAKIGTRGAEALIKGPLGQLRKLSLSGNRITDQGAALLANAEGLARLYHLDVSYNFLSSDAVEGLLNSPRFRLAEAGIFSKKISERRGSRLKERYGHRINFL